MATGLSRTDSNTQPILLAVKLGLDLVNWDVIRTCPDLGCSSVL